MASPRSTIVIIVTLFVLATSISATEYIVGDESGWTLDYDYQTWAKDKVFFVGDTLVFNYPAGAHSLAKVNGTGFQQCSASSANGIMTSGRDTVTLLTPGRKWYICGVGKHCELRNMKLIITVMPQTMAPAPSPSATSSNELAVVPTIYGLVVSFFGSLALLLV